MRAVRKDAPWCAAVGDLANFLGEEGLLMKVQQVEKKGSS